MTDTKPTLEEQIAYAKSWYADNKFNAAILATLQSIKDAGDDVVEPTIYTKTFLRGSTMEEHDVVLMHDYDTLLSAYKLMRGKHAIEKQNAIHYKAMFEKAEARNKRLVELFISDEALQKAGGIVGTMDGYEGESPDADHFNWFKAMSAELLREVGK